MENLDRINGLINEKKYEDAKKELIGLINDEEKDFFVPAPHVEDDKRKNFLNWHH